MLSDESIRHWIKKGELVVCYRHEEGEEPEPLRDDQFQPNSIDVHLDTTFILNPWRDDGGEPVRLALGDEIELAPYERLLGATREWIKIPNWLAARIEGVSSAARRGLINQLAPLIPAGFEGVITLEIQNTNPVPIKLRAGEKIGQLTFEVLSSPVLRPYGHPDLKSKYQGQDQATAAKP
jgi:dCTP deaminase